MRLGLGLTTLCLGAFAAALTFAPARAFTIGGEAAGGSQYEVPKFDLEEQARNFRNQPNAADRHNYVSPFSSGTTQFGVQQGRTSTWSGFGSSFSGGVGLGPANGSRANRADFERMVTPESMR